MPADASIFGQIQPVRPRNMLADFANVAQIQGLQQNQQLGAMKMDELRRARSQEEALAGAYRNALAPDGTINRNALFSGVAGAGLGHKLPGIQESFAKQDEARTKAEKERLALAREKVGFVGQLLGSVTDQATYDAARQTATQSGLDVSNMPAQYDPALIEAKRRETLTVAQQLEQKWKAMEFTTPNANARLQAQVSTDNNQRSVNASLANANATREVAAATRDAAKIGKTYESEQGLRKEFEALPEVKNYKQALPSFKGIEDAVKRNTPMSDINIVYGIAKLYDPTSVVREGEYATVANSPAIPERIKGYAQYLAGGGKLTEEVKRQILTEAQSRIKSYEDQYTAARTDYESIAKRTGVDPTRVFPSPVRPAAKPDAAPPPAAGAGPRPGTVENGYRFKGGNPADRNSWEKV